MQVNHFYIPSAPTQPSEKVHLENVPSDAFSLSSDTSCSSSSFTSTQREPTQAGIEPTQIITSAPPTIAPPATQSNNNISKCSVEEIALRHFIENENFKEGVHAEGRIWHMLFRLFFWNIISCVKFGNPLANNVWISWMQVSSC